MDANKLRQTFLDFFERHGHAIIGNAPLIPKDDPSVLFTTAGMHPLVPFLLGEPHPAGTRLANVQKCLRTVDIMEVGDTVHLTFFEMLGYWSLADYGKEEAIHLGYNFFTLCLGLAHERLAITCFAGDEDAPRDREAAAVWLALGVDPARITFLPKAENWWGPVAQTGPCGPDTEIFYDTNPAGPAGVSPAADPERFWEIGNIVFIEYNRRPDGSYVKLPHLNIDTGLGLERILTILQGAPSPYQTSLFRPVMDTIAALAIAPRPYAMHVIADHVRAATFILAEGIVPGNSDQPYIARRLIRRAIRYGQEIGIEGHFLGQVADAVIATMGDSYPALEEQRAHVKEALLAEESGFRRTLQRGREEFDKVLARVRARGGRELPGEATFHLYDTYGFPVELTEELAQEAELTVDHAGFEAAFAEHRRKSRRGAQARFRGGLAERNPQTIRLHTATHLLHAALRRILGKHVEQRGSNITVERLRFDFSHPQALTDGEIEAVETLVNEQIGHNLAVSWQEMSLEEAQENGALGLFEERYGDQVKVYTIGDFSKEVCGGPHVARTGELGHFRVVREKSVGAGVRRIRAVLE